MTEKKDKKKKILIGVLICVLAIVALFIAKPWNKEARNNTAVEEPCENCTVHKNNPFDLSYSGETIKYNAYDFIIEKMSQAQYWTYDEYHTPYWLYGPDENGNYFMPSYEEEPIINATGFTLFDEDSASFARGCEGRLIINFSENTADANPDFRMESNETEGYDLHDEPFGNMFESIYEFNDGIYYYYTDEELTDEYKQSWIVSEEYMSWNDTYNEIKRTMEFYETIFKELDIPLMNMPKGTLASYKNKTIEVPKELLEIKYWERFNDDKIHTPFDERVGWDWYWENDEDNVWLDDYRDIFNQQFPEATSAEMETIYDFDDNRDYTYARYAPIFLSAANPNRSAEWKDLPRMATPWSENEGGAVAKYWLKPLYKHIFGFSGVYFTDSTKFNGDHQLTGFDTLDDFNGGLKVAGADEVVALYNAGECPIGFTYSMDGYCLNGIQLYMQELCDHYGVENPYGPDFLTNMHMLYDYNYQRRLGIK